MHCTLVCSDHPGWGTGGEGEEKKLGWGWAFKIPSGQWTLSSEQACGQLQQSVIRAGGEATQGERRRAGRGGFPQLGSQRAWQGWGDPRPRGKLPPGAPLTHTLEMRVSRVNYRKRSPRKERGSPRYPHLPPLGLNTFSQYSFALS